MKKIYECADRQKDMCTWCRLYENLKLTYPHYHVLRGINLGKNMCITKFDMQNINMCKKKNSCFKLIDRVFLFFLYICSNLTIGGGQRWHRSVQKNIQMANGFCNKAGMGYIYIYIYIYIYRIMSIMKVETDISTSIAASPTGQAVN